MATQTLKQKIEGFPRVQIDFEQKIRTFKKIKDKTKVNIRYCLVSPFSYIHIYWDPKIYEVVYDIEEPTLTEPEKAYKEKITTAMRDMIDFETVINKDQDTLLEYIDKRFLRFIFYGKNLFQGSETLR